MARTPVGAAPQPRTDTALFAHIAWRLESVGVRGLGAWARSLGLATGADAIRRAPQTAARLDRIADRSGVVRPWALLDFDGLDVFLAAVRLRCTGPRAAALRGLERVPGVVELLALDGGRDLLALVVYERRSDERALHTSLGEFADLEEWRVVDERRPLAAIATFRALARRAAAREGLRA